MGHEYLSNVPAVVQVGASQRALDLYPQFPALVGRHQDIFHHDYDVFELQTLHHGIDHSIRKIEQIQLLLLCLCRHYSSGAHGDYL